MDDEAQALEERRRRAEARRRLAQAELAKEDELQARAPASFEEGRQARAVKEKWGALWRGTYADEISLAAAHCLLSTDDVDELAGALACVGGAPHGQPDETSHLEYPF